MTDADRARLDDLAARLDRLADAGPPAGPCVAEVSSDDELPEDAGSWFAMQPVVVGGDEVEGEAATFTPSGPKFRAFNLGGGVPDEGDRFLCVPADGRYVFVCS